MAQTFRDKDMLFRFGGEEFMVLLPMTDAASAMAMAERIREEMASKVITVLPAPILSAKRCAG